jgi:hypothetical protein
LDGIVSLTQIQFCVFGHIGAVGFLLQGSDGELVGWGGVLLPIAGNFLGKWSQLQWRCGRNC